MPDAMLRINKEAFSVGKLKEESDEKTYWQGRTPRERLEVVEYLRQMAYGYDSDSSRLQRLLEVAKR